MCRRKTTEEAIVYTLHFYTIKQFRLGSRGTHSCEAAHSSQGAKLNECGKAFPVAAIDRKRYPAEASQSHHKHATAVETNVRMCFRERKLDLIIYTRAHGYYSVQAELVFCRLRVQALTRVTRGPLTHD